MLGCIAHEDRFLCAVCSTCGSSFSFRLSGPKRFKTMFLRYLYINPCKEPTFCLPKIAVKVSGYQLWNNRPSCWKIKWLSSGSVDTMTGRPTKLVRNTGPYLAKWQHPYHVMIIKLERKDIIIYFFQIGKLQVTYLSILFRMKGGMSVEVLGAKNWRVSPRRGKPIEPGGSFPLHLGFLHL